MIEYKSVLAEETSTLDDWTPFGWRVVASATTGTTKKLQLARDTEMPNYQRLADLERIYNTDKRNALASARDVALVNEKYPKGKIITLIIIGIFLLFSSSLSYEFEVLFLLTGAGLLISGLALLISRLVKGAKPINDFKRSLAKCGDAISEAERAVS